MEGALAVGKSAPSGYNFRMTVADLKNLLERAQTWPEEAQNELVSLASQIESELHGSEYIATQEELRIIDAAIASIDDGQVASDQEVEAAFAKFRAG